MKIKNLLLALSIIIISMSSCMERDGCQNVLAQNFDSKADIDCCCEYDVESVIAQIKGIQNYKEECGSQGEFNTNIEIVEVQGSPETIKIIGIGMDKEHAITAEFKDGVFEFNEIEEFINCNMRIQGTLIPSEEGVSIEVNTRNVGPCLGFEQHNVCKFTSL